ncbi:MULTISPECIES: hypothetical protein [Rhizobium/Agrobacterium group]|uniref:Type I secretion protein n=2 Tax=Agrobacterium tumefaciens complex TaxID=1183400 RepID=A0AAE6ELI8_AGRTU|nr:MULTISPECIES: hypothetical protein [Rhizobium/Agrobacterium group]KRA69217.1 hypothetical protein ASD85_03645 [Rhizobium sp. Root651]MCA2372449.1 hypothetical protein [Agrobacterium tomkonis CIP 111-78]QCL90889.1 hypothetical protein CFBP6623_16840 [Agrobacterium tumefaciens]QCM01817.1 hypothetical protein CFBP6624_16430 [Agrobacterium tumefaciens]TKT58066.1 hypothetical protein YA62_018380 [Agrobacterium sp. LC34]
MHIDKISDMIAHFIGMFDTVVEEARLRSNYSEGPAHSDPDRLPEDEAARLLDKNYDVPLEDYDPGVKYRSGYYDFDYIRPHFARAVEYDMQQLANAIPVDISGAHFRFPGRLSFDERELVVHTGPGSVAGHLTQVNILQDDDYLNMTDGPNVARDTTFVTARTVEFYNEAAVFTPFSTFQRTDSYDALQALAKSAHDYIEHARDNDVTSLGTGADQDFVLAGNDINGLYINGAVAYDKPTLDDFMPDRGIAKPAEAPEKSDVSLHEDSPAGNSLDIAAGANVVANIATLVNTGVMTSVTAVMGDYHQIDAITQAYIYSDRDEISSVFTHSEDQAATAAYNIASFQRSVYPGAENAAADSHESGEPPIFPTAWRVSVLEGDVSFVHWIEQYQFISDNDTMTVTTSGASVSLLTGGNAALNIANFLGIGMQYDLIIVGGNVLDMNLISQIAVLYDNDWARANPDAPGGATIQSGNNLLWNDASIHNVGSNDRFETMPDYMHQTVNAINERDPNMPDALAHDANFAGYQGLNVLYITGNLYDVSIIKQVSVLGDSDDVTQAAAKVLENNDNATIHIDTGSNAVVNIAQIVDYDSFGSTTYVAGGVYSDAILIQGGIIENDTSQPTQHGQLANEVIAFLHDDPATIQNESDGVINGGHDLSWSNAHPSDVMQTVVA